MKKIIRDEKIKVEELLDAILRESFAYFLSEINPENGLIADKNQPGSASSITVTGLGISCYIVGVESTTFNDN